MKKVLFLIMFMLAPSLQAQTSGGISLDATRVIFNKSDLVKAVKVTNSSKENVFLMRAWISDINTNDVIDEWVVTPPIYKLDNDSAIQVKISSLNPSAFSQDRESVFYLNVLTIPSTEKVKMTSPEVAKGQINIALNTKIKVFYRPDKIANVNLLKEYAKIDFKLVGGKVSITNPTPYYINFHEIKINNKDYKIDKQMVAPFSSVAIDVKGNPNVVTYRIINDFGGVTQKETINL